MITSIERGNRQRDKKREKEEGRRKGGREKGGEGERKTLPKIHVKFNS